MASGDNGGSGAGGFFSGVAQNIAANLCATAIGLVCLTFGISATEKLEHPANWPLWIGIGLLLFVPFGWNSLKLVWSRWWERSRIAPPPTDRIGILIARFVGDTADNSVRETIREGLQRELGHAAYIVAWPEQLALVEGATTEAQIAANNTAQTWLSDKKCDVLVWGRVKSSTLVIIHFTPAEGKSLEARTHQFDERLELAPETVAELGAAIAARAMALAAPSVTDAGHYLVPRMRSVAELLEPICARPPSALSSDARAQLNVSYARALRLLGEQTGNSDHLIKAVAAYSVALVEYSRLRTPLDWAATQNHLGNALIALGKRESGTARLEQAVVAYSAALCERTRERVPLDWATTQNNLGNALLSLGKRESSMARLEQAVVAYHSALEERTRDRVPLDWATTQNNLGAALKILSERESGTARLEQAVAAYRAALSERTRGRVPLDWATTQNNLGNALLSLGKRERVVERLEEAVAAYRAALIERRRERVPLDWATTQNNLGNALLCLSRHETDTVRAQEAIAAYREALEERDRGRVPLDWAMTQNSLGTALQLLGEREDDIARLREALASYRAALVERSREAVPLAWAMTQNNLASVLLVLGRKTNEVTWLSQALTAVDSALAVYREANTRPYLEKSERLRSKIITAMYGRK